MTRRARFNAQGSTPRPKDPLTSAPPFSIDPSEPNLGYEKPTLTELPNPALDAALAELEAKDEYIATLLRQLEATHTHRLQTIAIPVYAAIIGRRYEPETNIPYAQEEFDSAARHAMMAAISLLNELERNEKGE